MKGKNKRATFDTVRQLALALPGVEESSSHGWSAFRVRGKIIGRFKEHDDSLALKVEYTAREVLMGTNPETFYLTDHYRCYPWVLVRLSKVDPDLLRRLIEDAWRGLAPKRVVAARDAHREILAGPLPNLIEGAD